MGLKKFFKKAGKDLKKVGKKLSKTLSQVAPVLAIVPGVGTIAAGAISAVAGQANKLLNKGGKYTAGISQQLNKTAQQLTEQITQPQVTDRQYRKPAVEPNTTVAVERLPDSMEPQGPAAVAEPAPRAGGFDGKTIAIVAAAGVAVLLLMRKR